MDQSDDSQTYAVKNGRWGEEGPRPEVESEKICSLFPRTLLWRWQLEDHGQDHLENRFTREKLYSTSCMCGFVLRTCDTNIALLPQYLTEKSMPLVEIWFQKSLKWDFG